MTPSETPTGKPRSSTKGAKAQSQFKHDLSRFVQSVKEMQSCLEDLNQTVDDHYSGSLPRAKEFQRALQDENTLVNNFIKDTNDVEDQLRRFLHEYGDGEAGVSGVASANRSSEFNTSVLGALFKGQNVFFSESFKVSQVLLDIVSQTKRVPTSQEVKLTCELQKKLDEKPGDLGPLRGPPVATAVSPFAGTSIGGHRGPGALIGGAYGNQPPQSKGPTIQVKPASRFSTPPSTATGGKRIYI